MITRALMLLTIFFLLAALQTSLVPRVFPAAFAPNFLLILPLLVAAAERPSSSWSLWSALAAGFFWDAFSSQLLGQGAVALVAAVVLVKIAKARYVRLPILP